MNLSDEDRGLLEELCRQNGMSHQKVLKMLQTVYDFEFKERRRIVQRFFAHTQQSIVFASPQ